MDIVRPQDKTATLGLDQGYLPLHVRRIEVDGRPCLLSLWRPTPEELALLNAGGVVSLEVLGEGHPPVRLSAVSQ